MLLANRQNGHAMLPKRGFFYLTLFVFFLSGPLLADEPLPRPTMKKLIFSPDQLPEGCAMGSVKPGEELPFGIKTNPYISTDRDFVEPFIKGMMDTALQADDVEEALFSVYHSTDEIGVFAFRFKSSDAAEKMEDVSQEYDDDIRWIIRANELLVMVWWDAPDDPAVPYIKKLVKDVLEEHVRVEDADEPVQLIFDTDIMGDVDDVGTVAVLHALANEGEVEILAMGVSGKNPWCPLCLDALNVYFQRPNIPIGVVKGPGFDKRSKYAEGIANEFPHNLQSAEDAPNAALLYREVLAKQPDKSVVFVSVGQITNVRNLLITEPDEYSDLNGVELVDQKVKIWICMGGKIPEGSEANLIRDGEASACAVENWPTPIVFTGWEIGQVIMTGARLTALPESSPVRRAYELYNGLTDRQSWDQTAVLYAVRGLGGGLDDFWDLDGSNEWHSSPDKNHAYLVEKMLPEEVAIYIEELMLRGLRSKDSH